MRHTLNEAAWHVAHRSAFGGLLADKPLMQNVIADLAVEAEAATALAIRLAAAVDADGDPHEAALRRIALPLAKFWVCKRTPGFVAEALECLGGNGYVEESGLPLRYREAPLNSVWEGSGNVNALDVLRALAREPEVLTAWITEVGHARGGDARLDRAVDDTLELLGETGAARGRCPPARRADGGLPAGRAAGALRSPGGRRRVLRLASRHVVRRHVRDPDLPCHRPHRDRRAGDPGRLARGQAEPHEGVADPIAPLQAARAGEPAQDPLGPAAGEADATVVRAQSRVVPVDASSGPLRRTVARRRARPVVTCVQGRAPRPRSTPGGWRTSAPTGPRPPRPPDARHRPGREGTTGPSGARAGPPGSRCSAAAVAVRSRRIGR